MLQKKKSHDSVAKNAFVLKSLKHVKKVRGGLVSTKTFIVRFFG